MLQIIKGLVSGIKNEWAKLLLTCLLITVVVLWRSSESDKKELKALYKSNQADKDKTIAEQVKIIHYQDSGWNACKDSRLKDAQDANERLENRIEVFDTTHNLLKQNLKQLKN